MLPDPGPIQQRSVPAWAVTAVCVLGLMAIGVSALDLGAYG